MIGRTVSHYQIVGTLGSGGMGVVYRAIDIKLGRPVALKFLTEQLAKDHEAVLRFEREARASSALNHPGICTVYEIEEADGQVFIAMELLEGESLHDRLVRGALPFDEAIDYAVQLIDALHAASVKGILHRDIKPANIFLVAGGRAKLLDFGLAKVEESNAPEMETVVRPMRTSVGTVSGTAGYMSPEQALGRPVDSRSDLFSFGLVLSEMVTGQQVFAGSTAAAVYDGILNRVAPAPSATCARSPALFDHIIEKALRKVPDGRYQTAAEFRADLKRLREPSGATAVVPLAAPVAASRRPMSTFAVAAAVLAVLGGAAAVYVAMHRDAAAPAAAPPFLTGAKFTQVTERPGLEAAARLTPDGSAIVYASQASGNWDIYWQRLDGSSAVNLTSDSAADEFDPAVSPDGREVAFRSEREGGGIFVMAAAGGNVRRLSNFCHNPSWSPDQASIVCATERVVVQTSRLALSPLWILDVRTGSKRQLTTFDGVQPSWSPKGDRIAYWSYGPTRIWTVPAAGGAPVALTEGADRVWNPVWSPDGEYVFYASNLGGTTSNLWRVPIDVATGLARGPSEPVTTPSSNAGFISFSGDGSRMAYVDESFTRNFSRVRFDRPGDAPAPVTRGAHVYRQLDLSPDQTRLAYASNSQVFVMNLDGTAPVALTDKAVSRGPRWSPDGSRIAFYSTRGGGGNQIWTISPDGNAPEQVTNFPETKGVYYPVWSPDGKAITATSLEGLTLTVDLTVPLERRVPQALPPLPMPGMTFVAWLWSPDGTQLVGWKLLADGQSGGIAIYDTKTRAYREIASAGIYPTWVRQGKALLIAVREQLRLVDLSSLAVTPVPTPARFASDFALTNDERWLYYAEDQREGNVWLITWPGRAAAARR